MCVLVKIFSIHFTSPIMDRGPDHKITRWLCLFAAEKSIAQPQLRIGFHQRLQGRLIPCKTSIMKLDISCCQCA